MRSVGAFLSKQKLGHILRDRGIRSFNDFAKKVGIHRNTLRDYLSGDKKVFSDVVCRISDWLHVEPISLIDFETKANSSIESLIRPIISKYEDVAFILFGSRARGKGERYSDFDIGLLKSAKVLHSKEYLRIKQEILDIADDFPFSLDIINLNAAPAEFLQNLEHDPIVFLGGDRGAYNYFQGVLYGIQKQKEAS